MISSAAVTIVDDLHFSECPRWRGGRLWFSDFYAHRVLSVAEDGSDLRVEAEVPGQPSGLGWLPDGRLLVVSMRDQRVLRQEADGSLVVHADLAGRAVGHLNDMLVDGAGRAYVGSFGFDLMGGAPLATSSLFRVDPDGSVVEAADGLFFPNAVNLTADGTLLVNETIGNRVTAFDVAADGALSERRTWAEFAPTPTASAFDEVLAQVVVAPDGGGIDRDGGLWVADALGGKVLRLVDGAVDRELIFDTGVFACGVGGASGETLFVCAAPDFFEEPRKAAREGRLLAVPLGEG